jgi:ParB family transcriptional regulator, chromosome partitioning protein
MTKTSLQPLDDYKVFAVPTAEIYLEPQFNCREGISPLSIQELARSIESKGLQSPVIVQPRCDVPDMPAGYNYRLIVGFRRFNACAYVLKWKHIPAIVREGIPSDHDARVFNLVENIDRKDLNIMEEARAIRAIYPEASTKIITIAQAVRRPPSWVAIRLLLLKLPEKVQRAAAEGLITQGDIRLLASISPTHTIRALDKILADGREKHKKRHSKTANKMPEAPGMRDRVCRLIDAGLVGLPAKLLLWAGGLGISDEEIDREIDDYIKEHGHAVQS